MDQSESLALPELKVTAGILLIEAGVTPAPEKYFQEEADFWTRGWAHEGGWQNPLRLCLMTARAGYPEELSSNVQDHLERTISRDSPAIYGAIRAALNGRQGNHDRVVEYLRLAIQGLGRAGGAGAWMPIYAEGRLCRSPRDYIAALNDRFKAGLIVPPAPEDGKK